MLLLLTAVGISKLPGGTYLVRYGELMQALAIPRQIESDRAMAWKGRVLIPQGPSKEGPDFFLSGVYPPVPPYLW